LIAIKPNNPLAYKSLELIVIHQYHRAFLYNTIFELISAIDINIPCSDSTESRIPSIPDAIGVAFATWLISTDNNNWARFDEEKYDAVANYELVNGQVFRKAMANYPLQQMNLI